MSSDRVFEIIGQPMPRKEDRRLLTVVIAGSDALTHAIDAHASLAQQVEVRVELAPLSREEAARYLGARVEVAGGSARLLLPGAIAALHDLSGGRPGRLSTLADNALFEAYLAGRSEVARSDVERACADLCWGTPPEAASPPRATTPPAAPRREAPAVSAQAEITAPQEALVDLDSELEAVFEAPGSAGPARRAEPAAQRRPGAGSDELPLEVLDAPPKDEVDDLFMELLDD